MNIQWFPGHMTKTRKQITEDIKLVDIVFELLDARIPVSSSNPELDAIIGQKPKIVIMNKSDLADEKENELWKTYFEKKGVQCILVSCATGDGINKIYSTAETALNELLERRKLKGITENQICNAFSFAQQR